MKVFCKYDELKLISEIKTNPNNRNKHTQEQIEDFAKVLLYQGVRRPVDIDKSTGLLSAGHLRLLSAAFIGWDTFPVVYQEYTDATQAWADHISDNAFAQRSYLDFAGINIDLPEHGPEFDIDFLGINGFGIESADKIKEWAGMPEFISEDKRGYKTIQLHFHSKESVQEFAQLIGQPITDKTRYIQYPIKIIEKRMDKIYEQDT